MLAFAALATIWSNLHDSLGLIIGLGLLQTDLARIIYSYIVKDVGGAVDRSLAVGEPIGMVEYLATLMIMEGVILLRIRI